MMGRMHSLMAILCVEMLIWCCDIVVVSIGWDVVPQNSDFKWIVLEVCYIESTKHWILLFLDIDMVGYLMGPMHSDMVFDVFYMLKCWYDVIILLLPSIGWDFVN